MATTNSKFVAKNGLAVGTSIDVINSSGQWIGATGSLNGATGPAGATGAQGIGGATGPQGVQGIQGVEGASGITGASGGQGNIGATGEQGIQGASGTQGASGSTGLTGATGLGATGLTGATGLQGPSGQSSSYYNYTAKTTSQSGDPGSGFIIWNNSTILSSTQINVSHLTINSVDVDIFLEIVNLNDTFVIQEANDSTRFQKWRVSGTPVMQTGYHQFPVTLLDSGGTAIGNNDPVILAIVSTPVDGATGATGPQGSSGIIGASGVNGASGIQGASGSIGLNGATGTAGTNGATGVTGTNGATGSQGVQGIQGIQGASGVNGATGIQGATGAIQNWVVKTTTYTAVNKDSIVADTSGGVFTITLPATPSTGFSISLADGAGTWATNNLTVARNGSTIEGSTLDLILDVNNTTVNLVYDGSTWQAFANIGPQGASGANGASGSTGPIGVTGSVGATGITGASGPAGGARVGATGGVMATITPNAALYDIYVVNALGASGTIAAPSGSPVDGQRLVIRIEDNGTIRGLAFAGATGAYRAIGTTLPTATSALKVIYIGCQYNAYDSFWDVVAVATQA